MPRRRRTLHQHTPSVFNYSTLINVLLIPFLTTIFMAGGVYFMVKDIPTRLDQESAKRETSLKEESDARDKLRNSLGDYASKTTQAIYSLSADQKVTQEHMKSVDTTLEHVVTGLQNIESAVGHPKGK